MSINITETKGLMHVCGKHGADPRYALDYVCIKGGLAYTCNGHTLSTMELMPREDNDGLPSWFGIPVDIFKLAFRSMKKGGYIRLVKDNHSDNHLLLVEGRNGIEQTRYPYTPLLGESGKLVDVDKIIPETKYELSVILGVKQLELLVKQAKNHRVTTMRINLDTAKGVTVPVLITTSEDSRLKSYIMPTWG